MKAVVQRELFCGMVRSSDMFAFVDDVVSVDSVVNIEVAFKVSNLASFVSFARTASVVSCVIARVIFEAFSLTG